MMLSYSTSIINAHLRTKGLAKRYLTEVILDLFLEEMLASGAI